MHVLVLLLALFKVTRIVTMVLGQFTNIVACTAYTGPFFMHTLANHYEQLILMSSEEALGLIRSLK